MLIMRRELKILYKVFSFIIIMRRTRRKKNIRKRRKKHVFTRKQYSDGNGILTSVWGPPLWHFLTCMSFNYPIKPTAQQKKQYKQFIVALQHVLPCGYCRKNLKKNLKCVPLRQKDLQNRDKFSRWMFRLHEQVNKMLGKKSGLTYYQVRDRYEHFDQDVIKRKRQRKRQRRREKRLCRCVIWFQNPNVL